MDDTEPPVEIDPDVPPLVEGWTISERTALALFILGYSIALGISCWLGHWFWLRSGHR